MGHAAFNTTTVAAAMSTSGERFGYRLRNSHGRRSRTAPEAPPAGRVPAVPGLLVLQSQIRQSTGQACSHEHTFAALEVQWEWQRLGRFRGLVDGLVFAQVALVSNREGADPAWIVYLTGRSQALEGRHPTEFDAMAAAEAALFPPDGGGRAT